MGRLLQIRVSADTFRPEDMEKTWPALARLGWPQPDTLLQTPRGVLELISALAEQARFGDWPDERKKTLAPDIERASYLKLKLEAALSDWKPGEADRLSYELEDILDELEKKASNV